MILLSLFLSVFLVVVIFLSLRRHVSTGAAILSPLFYFAILWLLAFPVHAFLIDAGWVDTQQQTVFSQQDLILAVWVSMACLVVTWWGAGFGKPGGEAEPQDKTISEKFGRVIVVMTVLISLAAIFLGKIVYETGGGPPFVGNEQNESRVGSGLFFMFSELFVFGLIATIPIVLEPQRLSSARLAFLVIFGLGLVLAFFMGIALTSRRIIVLPLFALVIGWLYTRRQMHAALPVLLLLTTFIAAPALQSLRYSLAPAPASAPLMAGTAQTNETGLGDTSNEGKTLISPERATAGYCNFLGDGPAPQRAAVIHDASGRERHLTILHAEIARQLCESRHYGSYFFLQTMASSYGFVDHLAYFLRKASAWELAAGVDQGSAWAFNTVLAFIPRSIWSDKPLHYGSVAEQKWLYPDMYRDNPVTMTLPPSFIVDFLFGFGIWSLALLCIGVGRLLSWTHAQLLAGLQHSNHLRFAFSLFTMAYLFNVVRGGTAFVQLVIIMLVVLALTYGVRRLGELLPRRET